MHKNIRTYNDEIKITADGENKNVSPEMQNAFGHYVDGKVTATLGTHTHIPTADAKILDNGTAYQTDVGMTGDYNSVIGMDKQNPIHAFTKGYRAEGRFTPANGIGKMCGVYIQSDDRTGLAKNIETYQL